MHIILFNPEYKISICLTSPTLSIYLAVGGVSGAPSHPYVINGEETAPNQYPWQVRKHYIFLKTQS